MAGLTLRAGLHGLALCATLAGCGSTLIDAHARDARISIDGHPHGRGRVEVRKTGLPETMDVRVEYATGEIQTRRVEREITGVTVVAALFSYLTGLLWAQQYPSEVSFSPTRPHDASPTATQSGWELPMDANPWLMGSTPTPASAPTSAP